MRHNIHYPVLIDVE